MDLVFLPEHMDMYSRNERLYKFLLSIGCAATPITEDGRPDRIIHICVASSHEGLTLPPQNFESTEKRPAAPSGSGENVIPFSRPPTR